MGANKNYENLLVQKAELEEKIEKQINQKLKYLRQVGISVLQKSYGLGFGYIKQKEDLSYLDPFSYFLLDECKKVNFSNDYITFQRPEANKYGVSPVRTTDKVKHGGEFQINRQLIHMSDRDFAKHLRSLIRKEKERVKREKNKEALYKQDALLTDLNAANKKVKEVEKRLAEAKVASITVEQRAEAKQKRREAYEKSLHS